MTGGDDGLRGSQYWRERAEEARARAGEMRSADAESAMLDIAAMYEIGLPSGRPGPSRRINLGR